jgi:hypothetical protein
MSINRLSFGARVRVEQLLQEHVGQVGQRSKRTGTQLNTLEGAKTETAPSNWQNTLQTALATANVSTMHRILYCILSALSSSFKQRTEDEAQTYLESLFIDGADKAQQLPTDPLDALCEEVFELQDGQQWPIELTFDDGTTFSVRSLGELFKRCHAIMQTSANDLNMTFFNNYGTIFEQGITPTPKSIFRVKSSIIKDSPQWKNFVAKAVQYSEVLAAEAKLNNFRREMDEDITRTLLTTGTNIMADASSVKACFNRFIDALNAAAKEQPLEVAFPHATYSHEFKRFAFKKYVRFLHEFLQSANGIGATDGSRLDSFDSAVPVEGILDAVDFDSLGAQKSSIESNQGAKVALCKLLNDFRKDLKTCLCSDEVKFDFCPGQNEISFREHFATETERWLGLFERDQKTKRRETLNSLQGRYDSALKAFQEPLEAQPQ